jgi:hypothetical protein
VGEKKLRGIGVELKVVVKVIVVVKVQSRSTVAQSMTIMLAMITMVTNQAPLNIRFLHPRHDRDPSRPCTRKGILKES